MIRGSRRLGFAESTLRVFGFSVGSLLWSKRMLFLALLSAVPVVIALVARVAEARGTPLPLAGGDPLVGTGLFGTMVWAAYVRFIVPVFGVFLGTGLIAGIFRGGRSTDRQKLYATQFLVICGRTFSIDRDQGSIRAFAEP